MEVSSVSRAGTFWPVCWCGGAGVHTGNNG